MCCIKWFRVRVIAVSVASRLFAELTDSFGEWGESAWAPIKEDFHTGIFGDLSIGLMETEAAARFPKKLGEFVLGPCDLFGRRLAADRFSKDDADSRFVGKHPSVERLNGDTDRPLNWKRC